MTQYNYMIGSSVESLVNVEDLSTNMPAPRSKYIPYVKYVNLGSGNVRGVGYPTAEWRWGVLKWNRLRTSTYRDALRSVLPLASNSVIIKTRINENSDVYQYFSAIAIWPLEESRETGRRIDFVISFKHLQVVSVG